ncbi:beta-N-acetylhexosaminidase family protein [Membranihabitans marinus]|uniref:hypothetical protein n=1 Tax=Membranihabitans marinus TaxID=1227546 RepID=UPI001F46E4E1|nr:hypothetical protein [Membranihabitans marinus]
MEFQSIRLYSLFITLLALSGLSLTAQESDYQSFTKISIITGSSASEVELKVSQLLHDRLSENNHLSVDIVSEKDVTELDAQSLNIVLGHHQNHSLMQDIFNQYRIPTLTELAPGPEGFLLKTIEREDRAILLAAGIDDRGCLYSVGEILRRAIIEKDQVLLPNHIDIRTAPAFEIRGTQFGQSRIAKQLGKVREWTTAETQRVILDYALAGANIFPTHSKEDYDFIKSYGLMVENSFGANTAGSDIPLEWNASESIGRKGYVCLSVPEARKFMLEKCENYFKSSPSYDLIKFYGGDGGGCECDRCNPYGLTFIKLVEEMAAIIHKYHPETRIYFTNQKFDNEDDNAIFDYLNEKPRPWLWAWGYGPGSDATTWQPGHRQSHRMDLFQYPGFGPYGLYPQEILHQIPRRHQLLYYNEITHWKYAQHAYIQMYPRADRNGDLPPHWGHEIYERRPDQFLTMVYNRLTFYAWPKFYHRVFNDLMRYGIGDITHSSGHHDHFNQWMWQRLLWAPRTSVEDVINEYCITWFGREAAPLMAEALLLLESNMEEQPGTPLDQKVDIERYYNLVKQAGQKMSPHQMSNNWLWRMYMQKGALDRYIQLDVDQQKKYEKSIISKAANILSIPKKSDIESIIDSWKIPVESTEMQSLKAEAKELGNESNELFGQRIAGIYNLKHDYIGLGWLYRQLQRSANSDTETAKELLRQIVHYEDPGQGGYYDNLGTANIAPNVVHGYPYDHGQPYVSEMLSESNRPSQRSMHFTQDEDEGVTLLYKDLDPNAEYRIRFTLVRPWYQERYADRMNQKSETIWADDQVLAKDLELPLQMSDFYSFDIPPSLTNDGELRIMFQRADDVARGDRVEIEQWRNSGGWGTMVSEIWLSKK